MVRQIPIFRVRIEARKDTDAAIRDDELESVRLDMERNVPSLWPLAMIEDVSHQLRHGGHEFAAVIDREASVYAEALNPVCRVYPNCIARAHGRHGHEPQLRTFFEKPSLFAVRETPKMPAVKPA
ncbi:hypothetical protein [Agrobacterium burrii]